MYPEHPAFHFVGAVEDFALLRLEVWKKLSKTTGWVGNLDVLKAPSRA